MADPERPDPDTTEPADILEALVDTPHVPVPSVFIGGSNGNGNVPGCCINLFTAFNYLWTNKVQAMGPPSDEFVALKYGYGGGPGVGYNVIVRDGPDNVSVTGALGEGTATEFSRDPEDGAVTMTYLRYGAKASFVLAGDGSVDLKRARALSRKNGCGCASQRCVECIRCLYTPIACTARTCSVYEGIPLSDAEKD
jgi:hypothetical protein